MTETDIAGPATNPTKRTLIVHDSLAFLALTAIAVALFGITLLLFRSFEDHRTVLAREFAERGQTELRQGQAGKAVQSLRAALSYAPDDYSSQLLLAQALADSGETDEATNYYLNLWAAKPGDGFINLRLARLARRDGKTSDAIRYYRASIFGDWRGDGSIKRRDVRLELVDYLMEQKDFAAARVELLIAAGNAPNSLHLDGMFADKLLATGDTTDALAEYEKAIADDPHNVNAMVGAGRIEYERGDYEKARVRLTRALEEAPQREDIATLAKDAERMTELSLSRSLPAQVRAQHLLTDAKIAQTSLLGCVATDGDEQASLSAEELGELQTRWRGVGTGVKLRALVDTAAGQETLTDLIFDSARAAATCGKPAGDGALLLKLAGQNARTP